MSFWCLLFATILGWRRKRRRKWVWRRGKRKWRTRRRRNKGRKSRRRWRSGNKLEIMWSLKRESIPRSRWLFNRGVSASRVSMGVGFFPLCRVFFSPLLWTLSERESVQVMILYHSQEHRNAKRISACFDKHPCVSVKACVYLFFFQIRFFCGSWKFNLVAAADALALSLAEN